MFPFFVVNGTVQLSLEQDGPYNSITYLDGFNSILSEKQLQYLVFSILILIYIYFHSPFFEFKSNLGSR